MRWRDGCDDATQTKRTCPVLRLDFRPHATSVNAHVPVLPTLSRRGYADRRLPVFYDCKGCGQRLKPKTGDCCVFCSYGSVPCPPVQQNGKCRRGDGDACDVRLPPSWVAVAGSGCGLPCR